MTIEEVKKVIQHELDKYEGGAIERLFEEKGLTLNDARQARRILNGERENPGIATVNRILRALGYEAYISKDFD